MDTKTIKGGTLRLIDINSVGTPEDFEKHSVLYKTGYFFWFDDTTSTSKTFKKVFFGDQLLASVQVKPDVELKMVYPIIKFGYDFISQMQGTPNSQCQKATEYLLHTSLILDDWKKILQSDKTTVTSILSPIEDLESKQVSWAITNIQWP